MQKSNVRSNHQKSCDFWQSCFAADDFAPSQKLQRQRIFCSSQSIEVNRSYIVGKKVGVPKVLNIIPPPQKKHTYTKTHTYPNTHTHTHTQSCMRGGRSKWLGGGSEHNVLCTLSRFALLCFSVALAVYYHIRNRNSTSVTGSMGDHNHHHQHHLLSTNQTHLHPQQQHQQQQEVILEIFNEKLHPLTVRNLPLLTINNHFKLV